MLERGRSHQQAALVEILQHHGIGLLDERAAPRRALVHLALGVDQLQEGDMVLAADARVVLAERGGDVYNAGTVGHGDVIVRNDHPGVLFIFNAPDDLALEVEQRLILHAHQIAAGEGGFIRDFLIAHDGGDQRVRHDDRAALALEAGVGFVAVDAQRDVAGQRPGRGRPGI